MKGLLVELSRDTRRAAFTRGGVLVADEAVDPAYRDPQLLRAWVVTMWSMGYAVAQRMRPVAPQPRQSGEWERLRRCGEAAVESGCAAW